MVRCTKCGAEVDVDEDELEEGEILNCDECEADLEVVQVHPVRLNVISDEDDLEEDKEDEENGDGDEDDDKVPDASEEPDTDLDDLE